MMGQLLTSTQLYPQRATSEWHTFLHSLTNGDRDERGNFLLRQSLLPEERKALQERAVQLAPWLIPNKRRDDYVKPIRDLLMVGGGSSTTAEEAAAIIKEYVGYVRKFPLWAVERACRMFGGGEVTAEMLDDPKFDKGMRPSSAQLATIVREVMRPFAEESTRIWMTTQGTVGKQIPEEERARVSAGMAAFAEDLKRRVDLSTRVGRDEAAKRGAGSSLDFNVRAILGEYAHHGLEPVYGVGGMLTSLSTLKFLGWTIQQRGDGTNVLVAPPPELPGNPRSRYANEGS